MLVQRVQVRPALPPVVAVLVQAPGLLPRARTVALWAAAWVWAWVQAPVFFPAVAAVMARAVAVLAQARP